ncbi:PTS lactose/cellobiose transporter subunit IIA [Iocasia frigidifontis]|uniref:PTS lactose/cellobiose transporter subunit IIA n=2 Tax=Iocasia fonsfrigidae TaxID=2682810 RepID=A0A8A7KJN4_9FIRM|nr:PTS lactose/cellobiose transporter subunit IIA [Iocasia fonsfrigidae]
MDIEKLAMQLIVNSGEAKSKTMEAISYAKKGNIASAKKLLEEAGEFLTKAHEFQSDIIQDEAEGKLKDISILLVHAQDHLMNAVIVIDLAREFIDLYEKISGNREEG